MPSSFTPDTIWTDGFPVDKAKIRDTSIGLGKAKTELNHGGYVTNPVTTIEATGTAALAAVHTAAVRHAEYNDTLNMPDADVTYSQASHGFFPLFRYATLSAERDVIFPANQGRVGTVAFILNRSTGTFNVRALREDPSNPGEYSITTVRPGDILMIRKNNDGPGNWTSLGKFQDGATATTADLSNLNASNLTSGTVPTARLSTAVISPHITSAVVSGAGGVVAANSVTAASGLVGDQETPGADRLYGTDGGGTKGWYAKPTGGVGGEPSAHALSHGNGQSDAVSLDAIQIATGQFLNARISESSVTNHQGALTLAQSQITGLGALLTDLQNQITQLKTEEYTGELQISGTGVHTIDRRAAYAYTITRLSGYTPSGSVQAKLSRDDNDIALSTITAAGAEDTATPSTVVNADETLKLHVIATTGTSGSPVTFAFNIRKVRV